MTRIVTSIAALALLGAAGLTAPAVAETTTQSCAVTWGSLPKTVPAQEHPGMLVNVRAGEHECFDRLVIDLGDSSAVGYDVRYVDRILDPVSGEPTALRGTADLKVTVRAVVEGEEFSSGYDPADPDEIVDVQGYDAFRQVALAWDYEGATTVGLGVRGRLPMRVFLIEDVWGGNTRLVVDVAHSW